MIWRAVALCLLAGCVAAPPVAGPERTATLINASDLTIWRFFGSNVERPTWEEDILGQFVLPPGERVEIDFADGSDTCAFDLLVEFENGETEVREGVDLCVTDEIVIEGPS